MAMTIGLYAAAQPLSAQSDRTVTRLADGVYEIQHRDTPDGTTGGNTTVIIGTRQVFVVDAGFHPSEAREDIAQIRQWTDKPVSFLLNTHFHNDHNLGNRVYMSAFPGLTIIAHVETKHDMDLFGPGSAAREARGTATYQRMLEGGKDRAGNALSDADKAQLKAILADRVKTADELKGYEFQSATLTFEHDFAIDVGNREVQVKYLGRGNTSGDAIVYLPRERIVVAGDLVVHPLPYLYDGYPSEWIQTLEKLGQLDAEAIVPGHGPVLRDKSYVYLMRDFFKSAVDQMNEALRRVGPAMSRSIDDVKGSVDLTPFRTRFAGSDKDLAAEFDAVAASLVRLVLREASLR